MEKEAERHFTVFSKNSHANTEFTNTKAEEDVESYNCQDPEEMWYFGRILSITLG